MSVSMSHRAAGFSLVELMIALLIGLIVVGGAVSLFITNRQTSRTTENLSRMQENARVAFEMMSRDIREAAGTPCAKNIPVANVVNNSTAPANWWANWGDGILGYDDNQPFPNAPFGSGDAQRVAGTDAIEIKSGSATPGVTVVAHNPSSAEFHLNTNQHHFEDGDVVMVCDYVQAAITQITNSSSSNSNVVHNPGNTVSPGNCTKGLGYPPLCSSTNGTPYTYKPNSLVVKLSAARWYVGNNDRNGRSLYRADRNGGQEVADGISNLQLRYLAGDQYLPASSPLVAWKDVTAVEVALDVVSGERVGSDGQPLTRRLTHVVALRNRAP